jgi:C2 domain
MTRYQVSVYAERLPRGRLRRPNPYAEITVVGGPRDGQTVGRTETVLNTVEPDFTKVFFIETDASINLPLKVSIYNEGHRHPLAEGIFEATEVFLSPGHFKVSKDGGAKYVSVDSSCIAAFECFFWLSCIEGGQNGCSRSGALPDY